MEQNTKKFVKWLVLADLAVIIILLVLGLILIRSNHQVRFRMLGMGAGQFIVLSNLAAVLIRQSLKLARK